VVGNRVQINMIQEEWTKSGRRRLQKVVYLDSRVNTRHPNLEKEIRVQFDRPQTLTELSNPRTAHAITEE